MEESQRELMAFSRSAQLKVLASGLLSAGAIDALIHGGWAGMGIGAVAALVLAKNSPELYGQIREYLPWNDFQEVINRRECGGRSIRDRLMGIHPEEEDVLVVDTEPLHVIARQSPLAAEALTEKVIHPALPRAAVFPVYPEDETLCLGHVVETGGRFNPHANGLIGQGLIAAAMQGWGKSQLVGRIIEQCGKCGMMVVVLDHKGEHETITDLPYINGLKVGADEDADFQLTTSNAGELVELVMQHRHQAIVNLPSYGTRWIDRAAIVAAVGRALMDYAEEKRRRKQRVLPCLVLLDEAQLYIPQDVSLLPPEAQENKQVLGELKNVCFALATNGRSAGYTMGFATQSLTFIAKWAIKSCAIQVFGRHVEKNALDMCEDVIDRSVATREDLKTFDNGTGVVFGFTKEPLVVQFDKKESLDLSETPKLEWLRKPVEQTPARSMLHTAKTLTLDAIFQMYAEERIDEQMFTKLVNALPDRKVENDDEHDTSTQQVQYPAPTYLRAVPRQDAPEMEAIPMKTPREAEMEQVQFVSPTGRFTAALSPELQRVYIAYEPGKSHRDIARELGNISHPTVGKIIQRLKDKGAINARGQKTLVG